MIDIVQCDANGNLTKVSAKLSCEGGNATIHISSRRRREKLIPVAWKRMSAREHIGFFSKRKPRNSKGSLKGHRAALPPPFDDLCLRTPFFVVMSNSEDSVSSLTPEQFLRFFDRPKQSKVDPFVQTIMRRCETIDDESDSSQDSDDEDSEEHRPKKPAAADFELTDSDTEDDSFSLGEYDYGGVTFGAYS